MASTDTNQITVRVEYRRAPPQVLVSRLNRLVRESQSLPNCTVRLRWECVQELERSGDESPEEHEAGTYPHHPNGYHHSSTHPILRGHNHCRYCLCSPCVIELPPEFLRGSCCPHPANNEKRHRLYRMFWSLLSKLGVWRDDEYLEKKREVKTRDDRREIIPRCVIEEVRRRYPSHDGTYRDYMSTFQAQAAFDI